MSNHARWRWSLNLALCGVAGLAVAAGAQEVLKSQRALVQQTVAATSITVTYSRPVARGRKLFGGIVPFGKVWNPGADTATSITVSTPVRINGQPLPAGSYSLWAEPGAARWTVILSRAHPVYHIPYPKGKDAVRLEVTPRTGSYMETLAFYFPVVEGRHADLVLHWGPVVVPLSIDVP
jgi:hypothetical protein